MTQPLHRTQVLLESQQHRELAEIAAREDRSVSDLLREIVRHDLERRRNDQVRLRQERLAAIEEIRRNRREMFAKMPPNAPEIDSVELLREAREERAEELWEAVRDVFDRG